MVKNAQSSRYKYLMEIPAQFRLLMTGTRTYQFRSYVFLQFTAIIAITLTPPSSCFALIALQNNLRELMALLSFILPKLFTEEIEVAIKEIFSGKAGTKQDTGNFLSKHRIFRAKKIMQPFVLRRRKMDVCELESSSGHFLCLMVTNVLR